MESLPPDFFILDDEADITVILTQQQRSNLTKAFAWDNESGLGNNNISSQQLVTNFDATNDKQNDIISGETTQLEQSIPTQGQITIADSNSTDSSRTISNGQLNLVVTDSNTTSNNNAALVYTQINPQFVVYASPGQPVAYPFPYQPSSVQMLPEVDIQAFQQEYTLRAFSKHSLLSLHAEIAEILKTYEANRITNNVNIQWIQTQVSNPTKSAVLIHYLIQELLRAKNMQPSLYAAPIPTQYYYATPSNPPSFPPQQQPLASTSYGHYQEHPSAEIPSTMTSQTLEPVVPQPTLPPTQATVPSVTNTHPTPTQPSSQQQPSYPPSTQNSSELPDNLLGKKKKPYACSYLGCTKSFGKKSRLQRHEETHLQNRKRFFCTEKECEKSYATKYDLIQHQREKHHIISNLYLCPFKDCCEKFEVKKACDEHMKQHKQTALNEANQRCDLSHLVFSFSGTLSRKRSEVAKMLTNHGAQVQATISYKVTHLVSTPADVASNSIQVKEARKRGIFIVSEGFVIKCIQAGRKVPEKEFLLLPHGEGAEKSEGQNSPSLKKQKISHEDQEEEENQDVDNNLKDE